MTAERCSAVSAAFDESLLGTASIGRSWLLVEDAGPWGPEALATSRLPARLRDALGERTETAGVRVVLIRRPGRTAPGLPRAVFLVHTGPEAAWGERRVVEVPDEILDADLEAFGAGRRPGFGTPLEEPVYVVCTHGRRDPCCAERGRPLAARLARARPESVWESSHIGGDRFAANLVCLPHGLYYGRMDADSAAAAVEAYEDRRVLLTSYRGRACYGFAVQVAEAAARERAAAEGVDDLRLLSSSRSAHEVSARFEVRSSAGSSTVAVRVRVERGPARRLTCHSTVDERPRAFEVVEVSG